MSNARPKKEFTQQDVDAAVKQAEDTIRKEMLQDKQDAISVLQSQRNHANDQAAEINLALAKVTRERDAVQEQLDAAQKKVVELSSKVPAKDKTD
jgi:chromosome segregation ATPase